MDNNYDSFSVEGGYVCNGSPGTFEGEFRTFSDEKLVGLMFDEGRDIVLSGGESKVVIGLKNQNGRMNFWKFSQNQSLDSLVYTVEETGTNEYKGIWVPMGINSQKLITGTEEYNGLTGLEEAFKVEGLQDKLDILSEIPTQDIINYLNPKMIENVLENGGNSGYLKLNSFL